MPNHIRNRITLVGDEREIKSLIEKFSTFNEKKPRVVSDNKLLYKLKNSADNPILEQVTGWYNPTTNAFEIRESYGSPIVLHEGIQEGFELQYVEEWLHFPDFNKIKPMPEELHISLYSGVEDSIKNSLNMGFSDNPLLAALEKSSRASTKNPLEYDDEQWDMYIKGLNNVRKYGYICWYDWAIENWGTKWNAYDCEKESDNVYVFDTAWSPVPSLIKMMSKEFPNVVIDYMFSDEDTGSNCGNIIFKNDTIIDEELPENGTKRAYEIAFELRPHYKEYYKLVGDNYVYVDEEDE